jgi:tRNA A-37 threonylcarbamoyl transferase component Bud32
MNQKKEYSFSEGQLSIKGHNIVIPKFSLINIIGEGANALVFKGHDSMLDRDVAVKIWFPRHDFSDSVKAQFLAEVRKISPIIRPQIVRIYDAGVVEDKYCYAILELVEGMTLRDWLLTPRNFILRSNVAKKISEELIFLHKKKIFHGDLHDRNIMIKESGEIILLDFGTSIFTKHADPHKRERVVFLETAKKILKEEDNLQFLDRDSLLRSPSECTPYAIDALSRILDFFYNYENKTEDFDQNKLTFLCACWIVSAPFFNIHRFVEIFKQKNVEYGYLIKFLSIAYSNCKQYLYPSHSRETEWLDMNKENLKKFIQVYLTWRKEYVIKAKNGQVDDL